MLNTLISVLTHNKQRCLLWVKGDQSWAQQKVNNWLSQAESPLKTTWFAEPEIAKSSLITSTEIPNTSISNKECKSSVHAVNKHRRQNQAQIQNQITDVRIKQYKKMLGQETDVLVYDAYAGLNPDALGALVGTIKQGGVCIVISPDIPQWLEYVDPEYNRLCVEPYTPEQISNYYIRYVINQLQQSPHVLTFSEGQRLTDEQILQKIPLEFSKADHQNGNNQNVSANSQYTFCKTEDQQSVVTQLFEHVMKTNMLTSTSLKNDNDSYAAILESDRGRGKSSSLGIFTGLILAELFLAEKFFTESLEHKKASKPFNIILTAPHASSVKGVFQFCETVLSQNEIAYSTDKNSVKTQNGALTFVAPDELVNHVSYANIILVDEAAAIPSQILLSALTEHSNAVKFAVFSTTIHGYEGTGRGFEYKFKPLLKNNFQIVENLSLTQPIRWSNNDFLEADINNMLMINASIPQLLEQQKISVNTDNVQFKTLSSKQLIAQPDKLNALFGLLVNAHYRTTPNDLRNMLDGPNMHIFCLEYQGNIIGALLLAAEGKITPELAEQIWQGRRRPKGHLLPQSLLAHSGFKQAGDFSYGRVVRIAIHPELQHQGLGSLLLNKVKQSITNQGFDFICTSFGVADNLVNFWSNNLFSPVRLGLKADASTGEYSLLMTQALNAQSKTFEAAVTARFQQTLLVEQYLNMRNSLNITLPGKKLLSEQENADKAEDEIGQYTQQDQSDLLCFSHHHKALDTCLLAMFRFIKAHDSKVIPSIIIDKILGKLTNKELIKRYKLTGEKQLVQILRQEWQSLIT